ncbi:MAG: PQQ-binding-like beta-propeller repeat protein [Vicinamibacterales bacterium]
MRSFISLAAATLVAAGLAGPSRAHAQVAERALPLPVVDNGIHITPPTAVQIGRRLFIGGGFSRLSDPTGNAVVTDVFGRHLPGRFPRVEGPVHHIVADGTGGWFLVGDFTHVDGQPIARFARVTATRTVDPQFRVSADGVIRLVALAHGRVYLAGDFSTVNGAPRGGLAAIDVATRQLSSWGAGFDRGQRQIRALTFSSIGVYLSGYRPYYGAAGSRVWGFDAGSGRQLFARNIWASSVAATSTYVYLAQYGYQRPLVAIDARTGNDTDWSTDLTFQYLSGTYGDYTSISNVLVDGSRLYFSGYFLANGGRANLAAVDAATGAAVDWHPPGVTAAFETTTQTPGLTRAGPAVVLTGGNTSVQAFGVATGGPRAFTPEVFGAVRTVAEAPEGAVVGGDFNGAGGTAAYGLASIDLDAKVVEPWIAGFSGTSFQPVVQLATDGTSLFAQRQDAHYAKVDPASGATLGEVALLPDRDFVGCRMRVAGSEVIVCVNGPNGAELGAIRISDWSYRRLPVAVQPGTRVTSIDVVGATLYLGGNFTQVNGVPHAGLAAVDWTNGAVLPFRADVSGDVTSLRAAASRLWVGGAWMRINGVRRRGLAEVDAASGALLPWNPDVPGVLTDSGSLLGAGVSRIDVDQDGTLYASVGDRFFLNLSSVETLRPTVSGRETGHLAAFSTATGRRLPWRVPYQEWFGLLPGCLLVGDGCLPGAPSPPTRLSVSQSAGQVTLSWTPPSAAPARTAIRLEVGTREGAKDLLTLDLPPGQSTLTAPAPPGTYFVRVRSVAGQLESLPSADVSFAVGPPDVPAPPLDPAAVVDGRRVTITWNAPSTGAPPYYLLQGGTAEGRSDLGALPIDGAATNLTLDLPAGTFWTRLTSVNGAGRSAPAAELLIDTSAMASCGVTPLPPTNLTAVVTGRTVVLTWQPSPTAPYVDGLFLKAGTQAGVPDIGSVALDPSATSFSTTAPPGAYHLWLVSDNLCFKTAASNVVLVVVP